MLKTINVVVIRNGEVEAIYTFPPEAVNAAEARFVEVCTLKAKAAHQEISATDLQTYLEDGYMKLSNGSVCLSPSRPKLN